MSSRLYRITRGISLNEMLNEIQRFLNALSSRIGVFEEIGVFAYLTSAAATTITTADTYYPIAGTFGNAPCCCFEAATTYTPGIKYTGTKTLHFEIDWHAAFSADVANTTVKITTKKNGVACTEGEMGAFCKNANQTYHSSGTCVYELATGDEVQLVVTSDGSGDIITFDNFTTTISTFLT